MLFLLENNSGRLWRTEVRNPAGNEFRGANSNVAPGSSGGSANGITSLLGYDSSNKLNIFRDWAMQNYTKYTGTQYLGATASFTDASNNGHQYFKVGDKSIMANDQFLTWGTIDHVFWNRQQTTTNFQAFKYTSDDSVSRISSSDFSEFTSAQAGNSPFLFNIQGYLGAGTSQNASDAFFAGSFRDDMVMVYHPGWSDTITKIPGAGEEFMNGGIREEYYSEGSSLQWGEPPDQRISVVFPRVFKIGRNLKISVFLLL